jgi:hypothetical protein
MKLTKRENWSNSTQKHENLAELYEVTMEGKINKDTN